MSEYDGVVKVRCPLSNHVLFEARPGMGPNLHMIIRCKGCYRYLLIKDVDKVHPTDPPPGTIYVEFQTRHAPIQDKSYTLVRTKKA